MAMKREVKLETEKRGVTASVVLKKNEEILDRVNELKEQMDRMERSNKKFLMAATMGDGRIERLTNRNEELVEGIMELLDQIDVLENIVKEFGNEKMMEGFLSCGKNIEKILYHLGIEEIPVVIGNEHNPEYQECIASTNIEDAVDSAIVELYQRGYRHRVTGSVLRYAKVVVNRKGD